MLSLASLSEAPLWGCCFGGSLRMTTPATGMNTEMSYHNKFDPMEIPFAPLTFLFWLLEDIKDEWAQLLAIFACLPFLLIILPFWLIGSMFFLLVYAIFWTFVARPIGALMGYSNSDLKEAIPEKKAKLKKWWVEKSGFHVDHDAPPPPRVPSPLTFKYPPFWDRGYKEENEK